MKITCEREKLFHAFQTAASVVPSRSPKPVLSNVKLEASADQVVLSATDLEVGIRIEVGGVTVESPGQVLLPVARFGSLLRENRDEKLSFESDGQALQIKGERSQYRLLLENVEEFPAIAAFESPKYHEIPARLLRELIRRTIFATDIESSRYALGGVLLEMDADKIIAVATDGRRMSKMEGPARAAGGHTTGDTTTIVPTRAMQLIERALSDADAEVQIAARSNDLVVRAPRLVIYSRLVEGRFPKWREVLPKDAAPVKIELTAGPMFAGLRQAAVFTTAESRGIDFAFGQGNLVMSAQTSDVGNARVELPIPYDGDELNITLDQGFVADFFKVLDAEHAFTLELRGPDSPALFRTSDGFDYVVMPLSRE